MKASVSYRLFNGLNITFLSLLSLICILPLVHVLALSFSNNSSAAAGLVKLWPVGFTTDAYRFILSKPAFLDSIVVTLQRVGLGTVVNLLLTLLVAYPLSKESSDFRFRTLYAWIFVFTILFNGGLIPWYMTIKWTGIMDTIWALILPGAVPVFNIILLLNFFRGLPKELDESASIDGGGHWTILWKIYVPLSTPALATITLFTIVWHWNSWFDGLILMKVPEHFPLSTYMQTILVHIDLTSMSGKDFEVLKDVSDRTAKASQIFLGALPIILAYPFLQRYFVKGIVLGSVKG
ncbi:carbohydrate ABC transporter permease [Paenibacillus sacheonensis]|uniref:ABC transporter permease subunit n=1 Tax=Paenibacillus sacheonensis TaxID=742054 RepID=A0A7X5C1T3_9BACL|nr:carbohydrate ABC transporter permease [Paenibacillus sacheonensis]MBM7569196.1 putative aldouronate transport system permease protein [Paenibacillus sacheonensis]NBC73021.1 ABC transporter permease subunit [Paenibacillus sacheonensis]